MISARLKLARTCALLDDSADYAIMAHAVNPYGDGFAAARIVEMLQRAERTVT